MVGAMRYIGKTYVIHYQGDFNESSTDHHFPSYQHEFKCHG
jgi:hypothetical protein